MVKQILKKIPASFSEAEASTLSDEELLSCAIAGAGPSVRRMLPFAFGMGMGVSYAQ